MANGGRGLDFAFGTKASDALLDINEATRGRSEELRRGRNRQFAQRVADRQFLESSRGITGTARDTGLGLLQGAVNLGSSAYGFGNVATGGLLEQETGLADNFGRTNRILERARTPQLRYEKRKAEQAFEQEGVLSGVTEYVTSPSLLGDLAATNAASMLPAAGTGAKVTSAVQRGALARGATTEAAAAEAGRRGARAIAGTTGAQAGGATYTQAYEQAKQEGLSDAEANLRALTAGVGTGVFTAGTALAPGIGAAGTEASVLSRLAGRGATRAGAAGTGTGVARAAGRGAAAAGRETAQEAVQEGGQQLSMNLASVDREVTDDLLKSAAMGSVAGGTLGLGMGAVQAPGALRSEINAARQDMAEELGRPDAGQSTFEEEGERKLTADRVLEAAGFQPTTEGNFVNEGLLPGEEFTRTEALSLAEQVSDVLDVGDTQVPGPQEVSEADVEAMRDEPDPLTEAKESQQFYENLAEVGIYEDTDGRFYRRDDPEAQPLSRDEAAVIAERQAMGAPDVQETGPAASREGLPLPEVGGEPQLTRELSERPGVGDRALRRARMQAREVFGAPQAGADGGNAFQVEEVTPSDAGGVSTSSLELGERDAFRVLREMGRITAEEEAEANRLLNQIEANQQRVATRPGTEVSVTEAGPMSMDEVTFQSTAKSLGYSMTDDGQQFVRLSNDFDVEVKQRPEVENEVNEFWNQDLLGDDLQQTRADSEIAGAGPAVGDGTTAPPTADDQAEQLGLFDSYTQAIAETFNRERPSATTAARIESNWKSVFRNVINDVNQTREASGLSPIRLTQSSLNSRTMRSLVDRAQDRGIDVDSAEATAFLREEAEAVASQDSVIAEAINVVAEQATTTRPKPPSMSEIRKYLSRRTGIKPGQMRGEAYRRFKQDMQDNGVTPGTSAFEKYLQRFSDSLTEQELNTPFGSGIRELYPSNTVADVVRGLSTPDTKQAAKLALKAQEYTPAPQVMAVMLNPAERAIENSSNPELSETKAAVKEAKVATQQAQQQVNNARKQEENAVYEQVSETAAAAEAEGANSASAARQQLDETRQQFDELVQGAIDQWADTRDALRARYAELLKSRSKVKLNERAERELENLMEEYEEGADPRITGLPKDVADPSSWWALADATVGSDLFNGMTDQQKFASFLSPMMERMYDLVSGVQEQHGFTLYQQIMRESAFFEAVNNLEGDARKGALRMAENLERYINDNLTRDAKDPGNPSNNKPFKRDRDAKYSRLPEADREAEPILRSRLDSIVQQANQLEGNYVPVEVAATTAEAESMIGSPVPSDAVGAYYGGRAIIIQENVRSEDTAYEAIMHERTHGGLEGLLGPERLRAVLNRLWTNPQTRKRIQNKMDALELTRLDAAEEVLADMVAGGERLNKSVFSKVRAALGRFTDQLLGISDYVMADDAVNELMNDTVSYMHGAKYELSLNEKYNDGLQPYMDVFQGEAVPTSPRFSRAVDALDQAVDGEMSESDVVRLSNRNREMVEDTMARNFKKRAGLEAQGTYHKARRMALNAMPLTQIANLGEGLFVNSEGVDMLKYLRDLKLFKQQEFNRTLNEKRTVRYDPAEEIRWETNADGERELRYVSPKGGKSLQQEYNTSVKELTEEWRELVNKRANDKKRKALDRVQQDGTFFRLHPELPWEQQSKLDHSKMNFTERERREAYDKLQKDWDSMGASFRDVYRKSQAIYRSLWGERAREVYNQIETIARTQESMPDPENPDQTVGTGEWRAKMNRRVDQMINQIKEGPYSPLQRRGSHYVVIRDPDGNVVFTSGHDSFAEAQMTEQGMKEHGGLSEGYTIAVGEQSEFRPELDGISQQAYQRMEKALEGAFPGADESDRLARKNALASLHEVYLSSMPDNSMLSHANRRKNVGGAVLDSFRAFNDYAIKSAGNLSSMRYDHDIQKTLADIKNMAKPQSDESAGTNARRNEYADAVAAQHLGSQQFSSNRLVDGFTQGAFLYWMSSPSQMALNVSQVALVTLPRLGSKYGVGNVSAWIKEASGHYAKTKTKGMHDEEATTLDKNSIEYQVMRELNADGTLDFTLSHDVADLSQHQTTLNRTRWDWAVRKMATFVHKSEVFNREVTAFAATRGYMQEQGITQQQLDNMSEQERAQKIKEIGREAREAVLETQFDYSQANKAVLTQGPLRRMVFQFQQFRLNMLGLMAKDVMDSVKPARTPEERAKRTEARRALAYMQGTQLALTGIKGSVAAPVLFGVANMFQDEDEISSVDEKMSQALPRWMTMGVMSGMVDTQRFGFQSLLPVIGGRRFMPTTSDPQDTIDHVLLNSLGPTYGLGSEVTEGLQSLAAGDFNRAVPHLVPRVFGDAYGTVMNDWNSLSDANKIDWYEQGPWDRAMNVVGLRSGAQAAAQADRNAIYSGMRRASERKSALIGQYAMAPGYEDRNEAMESIREWNQRWGADESLQIRNSSLERAIRRRADKQLAAERWGVPRERIPRTLKEMVNDD